MKPYKIVIVEDEELIREELKTLLINAGYVVDCVTNFAKTIDYIKSAFPDLILLDINLPEQDGYRLCSSIRSFSTTPILFITGRNTTMDELQALTLGGDDYITKPFSSGYLRARIHSLLKQREVLRRTFTESKGDVAKQEEETLSSAISVAPSMPQITRFDEVFIKQVVQAVESDIQNPDFKIEDLADTMQMSRTVFYRKIKSLFGVSPIDFVRDMRVKRAVQLLDSGEYTVSEVAYMSGFSSPQYFSRVFKQYYKMSPSAYRKHHLHTNSASPRK